MKNKIAITILIVFGLFFGSQASAILEYSRTPLGSTISNPINFEITIGEQEICTTYWDYRIVSPTAEIIWGNQCLFNGTTGIFEMNLPLGEYFGETKSLYCFTDLTNCEAKTGGYGTMTYDDFEVIEAPAVPIMPITDISSLLEIIGQLFTDLKVFIMLAIGLPVGFWVIKRSIALVTDRTKK